MSKLNKFRSNEDGSSSIEFLFWMPVMVTLVALTVDAVMLMNQNQTMYNLARDASRQVAVGAATPDEAEDVLELWRQGTGSTVNVQETGDGFVTTTISTPFSSIGNITGFFIRGNMRASVAMWIEGSASSGT